MNFKAESNTLPSRIQREGSIRIPTLCFSSGLYLPLWNYANLITDGVAQAPRRPPLTLRIDTSMAPGFSLCASQCTNSAQNFGDNPSLTTLLKTLTFYE